MKNLCNLLPAVLLSFGASACVLMGIEPDEIDVADEETGGVDTGLTGAGNEGEGADELGGDGDGDGDANTGDGDPSNDSDTGDDDDPVGDGDGDDNEGLDCLGLTPEVLSEGENPVVVVEGGSELSSTCGGAGPETIYQFTAPAAGDWEFEIQDSEFTEVLTLLGSCEPPEELICSAAPAALARALSEGELVYVVVDSERGTGTATLVVSQL